MPRKKPVPKPAAETLVLPEPPAAPAPVPASPIVRQWRAAREAHPGMVLLLRDGDCWRAFGPDAILLVNLLTLGAEYRGRDSGEDTSCFPRRMLEFAVGKLLTAGHRVALLEQIGD